MVFSFVPISIHALREEGDAGGEPDGGEAWISIHALREEGDIVVPPTISASL